MCEHCGCGDTATKHRPIPMDDPNRFMTINEFCDWVGVSRAAWETWCKDGSAPRHMKVNSRVVRIKVADALQWRDERTI